MNPKSVQKLYLRRFCIVGTSFRVVVEEILLRIEGYGREIECQKQYREFASRYRDIYNFFLKKKRV